MGAAGDGNNETEKKGKSSRVGERQDQSAWAERKDMLRGSWVAVGREKEFAMNWAAVGPFVVV